MTTYESVTGGRPQHNGRPAEDERKELDRLSARRLRVALVLTTAMIVVYFTFILLIAFDKSLLGRMITDGLGILLGVIVVLATWVLTWTYVAWVNRRYEPAAREIRERAR